MNQTPSLFRQAVHSESIKHLVGFVGRNTDLLICVQRSSIFTNYAVWFVLTQRNFIWNNEFFIYLAGSLNE
jgi:hypothetical protein